MNGKERMTLAMRHQMPDRVPVMCQLSLGHYFLNMKDRWKPHEIFFTSEGFTDSLVTLCRRYRFDGILVNFTGRDLNWMDQVQSIEEDEEGETITWNDNSRTRIPWDDCPQYERDHLSVVQYPDLATFDPDTDLEYLDRWPHYTWHIHHMPHVTGKAPGLLFAHPDYFFRTIDMVKGAVGNSISVHGEVYSPFNHFIQLFNYEQALIGLMTDPGKVEAILDRFSEVAIAWAKAQARRGVDAILISSPYAGGGFISPKMYKRFVVPSERAVADALHEEFPGIPVYTHTCGMLNDRLELLAESNVDGIDTLDPPPLGNTHLADAKRRIGHRLFIKGNMNSVAILTDSREQLIERAITTLLAGKPGGGYILSTACSVPPHVAPWKLELLADIAEEHGLYR